MTRVDQTPRALAWGVKTSLRIDSGPDPISE